MSIWARSGSWCTSIREPAGHDLQPGRHRPVAGGLAGDQERRSVSIDLGLTSMMSYCDDPVARNVDLVAVDDEVAVADQLARLPAGAGQARAVYDVVQARLEDLQQVVTGLAVATDCLLVVAAELLLQDAVAVLGLLLLLHLHASTRSA